MDEHLMDEQLKRAAEQAIMDYQFSLTQIEILEKDLEVAGDTGLGAMYGIEASMPKGKGNTSDKVFREVKKRERKWKQLQRHRDSVERIDQAIEQLIDEKQIAVIESLIERTYKRKIAEQLGVSPGTYYNIEREAIKNMAKLMYARS